MTADQQAWVRRSSVIEVGGQDRMVLLDLDDPAHPPRILTGPAAAVWQSVDGVRDLTQICGYVAEQFGLTADDVRGDVRAFLTDLSAARLIHAGADGDKNGAGEVAQAAGERGCPS